MKILKFRRTEKTSKAEFGEILVVDFFFFRRTLEVYRTKFGSNWKFVSTGQYTPGFQVERLADLYDVLESKDESK